jgi:hypothetical protein
MKRKRTLKPVPIGAKFGRLTVLREVDPVFAKNGNKIRRVQCRCSCSRDKIVVVMLHSLRQGNTKSCGCLQSERTSESLIKRNTTHGLSSHPLYNVHNNMMARCYNKDNESYPGWGGRGIRVCKAWHNLRTFFDWALSHGWKRGITIDRCDNNKGYYPSNCRFTTYAEQNNNTRRCTYYEYDGEQLTLAEIATRCGLTRKVLDKRLALGWSMLIATSTPVGEKPRLKL